MTDHAAVETGTPKVEPRHSPDKPRASWLVRLLREPMTHFLVLGAALFYLHAYLQGDDSPTEQQIVVTAGKVEHLAALFVRTWQRPPTATELHGLVDDYVLEEVAYREGKAMGLDQNDTILRRRIRQKLDFVAEDLSTHIEPTTTDLEGYLKQHADKFRKAPRLTFRQVYFDLDRHTEDLEATVSSVIAKLRRDASIDASEQGDRTLLEFRYADVSQTEIAGLFGEHFSREVVAFEPGVWDGPVPSAYGVHLVVVDDLQPGRQPELDEVRRDVLREWRHTSREELTTKFYQELLKKYEVVVEWPQFASEEEP